MKTRSQQRVEDLLAEIRRLQEDNDALRRSGDTTEAELRDTQDALAEAEQAAAPYVACTASGRVLYEGDHEAAAITAARSHHWRTHEHVDIDGSTWTTRQLGDVRRGRRPG